MPKVAAKDSEVVPPSGIGGSGYVGGAFAMCLVRQRMGFSMYFAV